MRYFGSLDENEWVANLMSDYKFGDSNKIQAGVTYKDKQRDYKATRFYYNLNKLNPTITDIYNPSDYINQENIENELLTINLVNQPKDQYKAGNSIIAGYLLADYYPMEALLINLGVRYEYSRQWVDYHTDG